MRALQGTFLAIAFTAPLLADWTIAVRDSAPGRPPLTITTYYKGGLRRQDSSGQSSYLLFDAAHGVYTLVEPSPHAPGSRKTYLAASLQSAARGFLVIQSETVDTGERRPLFGFSASHLITTKHVHSESPGNPPSDFREVITDGWYIDAYALPVENRPVGDASHVPLGDTTAGVPAIQFSRVGPQFTGFALREQTGDVLTEVTTLSRAPLDSKLFEAPPGISRVISSGEQLPWTARFQFEWQMLQAWFAGFLFG